MARKKKESSKISNYSTKQQLNIIANNTSNIDVSKNYSSKISNYTIQQQLNILANTLEEGGGPTPTPGEAVLQELSVTQNGTYTPQKGVDGYNKVIVNVDTGTELLQPINPNGYMRGCNLEGYDVNHILNAIDATNSFNTQFSNAFNAAKCNNCDIDTSIIVTKFANKAQGFDNYCFVNSTGWNKFYLDSWGRETLCLPADANELKISNCTANGQVILPKIFTGAYKNVIINTPLNFSSSNNTYALASTVQSLTFDTYGKLGTLYDREYTIDLTACDWTAENMMNTLNTLLEANKNRNGGFGFNMKFNADSYAELETDENFETVKNELKTHAINVVSA